MHPLRIVALVALVACALLACTKAPSPKQTRPATTPDAGVTAPDAGVASVAGAADAAVPSRAPRARERDMIDHEMPCSGTAHQIAVCECVRRKGPGECRMP